MMACSMASPAIAAPGCPIVAPRSRPVPAAATARHGGMQGCSSLRRVAAASSGGKDGKRVDWDGEWSSYVKQRSSAAEGGGAPDARRSNVYTTTGGGGNRGSSSRQRVPVDPAARMTRDAIKREEAFLLNAWTSEKIQMWGAAIAVLVVLGMLLAAGPPPADSRCTLPWC